MATHEFRAQPREERLAYYASADFSRELLGEHRAVFERVSEQAFLTGLTPAYDETSDGKSGRHLLSEEEQVAYSQLADRLVSEFGFPEEYRMLQIMFPVVFRTVERHLDRLADGVALRREAIIANNLQWPQAKEAVDLVRYVEVGILWARGYGLGRDIEKLGYKTQARSCQIFLRRSKGRKVLSGYVEEFRDRGLITEWDVPYYPNGGRSDFDSQRSISPFERRTVEEILAAGDYRTNAQVFYETAVKLGYSEAFADAFLAIVREKVDYGNGEGRDMAVEMVVTALAKEMSAVEAQIIELYTTYQHSLEEIGRQVGFSPTAVSNVVRAVLERQGYGRRTTFQEIHQGSATVDHAIETLVWQLNSLAIDLSSGQSNELQVCFWEELTAAEREVVAQTLKGVPLNEIESVRTGLGVHETGVKGLRGVRKLPAGLGKLYAVLGWGRPDKNLVPVGYYWRLSPAGVQGRDAMVKWTTFTEARMLRLRLEAGWSIEQIAVEVGFSETKTREIMRKLLLAEGGER